MELPPIIPLLITYLLSLWGLQVSGPGFRGLGLFLGSALRPDQDGHAATVRCTATTKTVVSKPDVTLRVQRTQELGTPAWDNSYVGYYF